MFLGFWSYGQSQGDRLITGKVICTQTGAGVNNFILSCNFTDEGGLYDGTNVAIGHYLYFNDGGYGYYLPIDSVLSSGPSTLIVRVVSTGTGLGAVPSTIGYISEGTEHFEFFPFVSGIPNSDQQVNSENSFYILDSILYYRLPERISGSSPPGYTPTADQSWLVQSNGDGKLYRYDPVLTDWIEFSGLDSLNGIYSGSDTIPEYTTATIDSIFQFIDLGKDGYFYVQYGELGGGRLLVSPDISNIYHNDVAGINQVYTDESGISLISNGNGSDDISIQGSVKFNKVITPTIIASNQNNYSPAEFPSANFVRLSSSSNVNITGFGTENGRIGRIIMLHNVGSFNITLKNQSGSSLAANRFALSDDYTMCPNDYVIAQYDTTSTKWRLAELPRQYIDSMSMSGATLRISLFNDKRPHKELDITENIQDIVGAMIGTQTNIAVTYNDGTGLISYIASGGGGAGSGSVIPDTFQIFDDVIYLSFLLDSIPATTLDISEYRQRLDTFEIVSDTLRTSLLNDNVPFSFVDLTSYLDDTDNQTLDTFEIASNILRASLTDDGLPFSSVDLSPYTVNIFNSSGVQDDLERYYDADSTKVFAFGQFPDFPDVNFDGRDKGFFYSPDAYSEVGIYNGDGVTGDYSVLDALTSSAVVSARDGNVSTNSLSTINLNPSLRNRIELTTTGKTNPLGDNRIWQVFNDTINYIAIGHDEEGVDQAAYFTIGIGGDNGASSFLNKNNKRAFAFQTYNTALHAYNWIESLIPVSRADTTGDNVRFYNGSYAFENARPSSTNGIMSFHAWRGNGTITVPQFLTMSQLADSISGYSTPVTTLYSGNSTIGTNRVASITDNLTFNNNSATVGERFIVSYDDGVSSNNFFQVKEGSGIWLQSSENNIILEGQTLLADILSPSTIGSNQNDYTGLDGGNFGRLDASTAINITGFDNGHSGRILPVYNISNTAITFTHNATSSTENRYLLPNNENLRLNNNDGAFFIYDSLTTKWRLISTNVGSPYTNSGRLLNGKSGHTWIKYTSDTLNDFVLGYFVSPSADQKTTYQVFGFGMEGDGGFNVEGKEVGMYGSQFAGLEKSYILARQDNFDLRASSRQFIGGPENHVSLTGGSFHDAGGATLLEISSNHAYDVYETIKFGFAKDIVGTPSDKEDYFYVYQGPGQTGNDTCAISMSLGIPQYTDTVGSLNAHYAVSRDRGFVLQALWNVGSGTKAIDNFNIIKAIVPPGIADTNNVRLQLLGKYDMVNAAPGAGNRIMEWVNGVPGWINTPSGSGGGNGIYGGDGNIPAGGSEVTMDTIGETVRFTMNTGNTTLREMIRMKTVENAFTRFFVLQGPTDSMRVFRASAGREYTLQTYGGTTLTMASDSIIKFVGDSLLVTEDIAPISGNKIRYIAGINNGYYVRRIEALDPNEILVSDGTDWVRTNLSAVNASFYTASPSANTTASGTTAQFIANEDQAFGDVIRIASDGDAAIADASVIATSTGIGLCTATVTTGNTGTYLMQGFARNDSWNWTVGGWIYLSINGTTGNTLTQTAPSATNEVIQIIGVATHTDRIWFAPQLVQTENP